MTVPASLKALFEKIGPVDAIVCAAGEAKFAPVDKATEQDWATSVNGKLMGQVNVVRFGAPFVREGGSITLVSGVLAHHPIPGSSVVSTVNAAVEAFAVACAVELGEKVRVNVVSPGWVTETLAAMGMDTAPGIPAAGVAEFFVRQIDTGAGGSVLVAAKA